MAFEQPADLSTQRVALPCGLTEREDDIDREVLRAHEIDVQGGVVKPDAGIDEPPVTPTPSSEPIGWSAERLATQSRDLLLTQITAALSTGKHLLLIGLPDAKSPR